MSTPAAGPVTGSTPPAPALVRPGTGIAGPRETHTPPLQAPRHQPASPRPGGPPGGMRDKRTPAWEPGADSRGRPHPSLLPSQRA